MKNRLRKLLDRLFSRYVSTGLVFALDVSISFISALLVIFAVHYVVSVAGDSSSISFWNRFVWPWLIVSTVSASLMFWGFKSYRIIIRHSSLTDIFRFCLAVALRARLYSPRHYEVAGYLTDIQAEEHLTSHSLPVFIFSNEADIARIAKKQELGDIIFAREEDPCREVHRLIPYATGCRLRLLVEPSIGDYRNVSIHGLRSVKVEDLLGRDEISISIPTSHDLIVPEFRSQNSKFEIYDKL